MDGSGGRWASSGLAWLTGQPDGPPDHSRSVVLDRAETVAAEITAHLGVGLDVVAIMTGRAALLGLHRGGRISAGGATRLLTTRDGWCALTLSRPDDVDAVPALIEAATDDPWSAIERWACRRSGDEVVDRARLLDLPVARLGETVAEPPRVSESGRRGAPRTAAGLLVADLSSMWAGPLCGQILAAAGATVVKVESPNRPDGPRAGDPTFYDWINHGKLSYAVDFTRDRDRLRALLMAADIVIEGSRPGALARHGLCPESLPGPDGRVWLRISGHGPNTRRVAFGDDAAVAGGLVGSSRGGPVFCADAVADPLTGLESALAVAQSLRRGGGEIIEVSMARVAASYAALPAGPSLSLADALPPQLPPATVPAAALGADNAAVEDLVSRRRSVPC
ncbi:CoA transferase [Mycolicibacterium sp. CH28]|uniref:CoA transferase n=1 Tax=Mycolicibacterium sp. CH28 TaxID=2512237 RepID=UPI00108070BC|nr:CoA transferase [Mycolicibacterium sp. CH28]TGD89857.1 CoA transferase [Mycolicibacterium sp. CH28]